MIGTIWVIMDDDIYLYILDYAKMGPPIQIRHEMLCCHVVPHVKGVDVCVTSEDIHETT